MNIYRPTTKHHPPRTRSSKLPSCTSAWALAPAPAPPIPALPSKINGPTSFLGVMGSSASSASGGPVTKPGSGVPGLPMCMGKWMLLLFCMLVPGLACILLSGSERSSLSTSSYSSSSSSSLAQFCLVLADEGALGRGACIASEGLIWVAVLMRGPPDGAGTKVEAPGLRPLEEVREDLEGPLSCDDCSNEGSCGGSCNDTPLSCRARSSSSLRDSPIGGEFSRFSVRTAFVSVMSASSHSSNSSGSSTSASRSAIARQFGQKN